MSFEPGNINYRGKSGDVYHWSVGEHNSFYWHKDWMHIAEDMTGLYKKAELDIPEGEQPTERDALAAIKGYVKKILNRAS